MVRTQCGQGQAPAQPSAEQQRVQHEGVAGWRASGGHATHMHAPTSRWAVSGLSSSTLT